VEYYKPEFNGESIPSFMTGVPRDQSYAPDQFRLWRVFKNSDDTLEIVSTKGIEVTIRGRDGYSHLGCTIAMVGSRFLNPRYAKYSRAFGANVGTVGKVVVPITWAQVTKEKSCPKENLYKADVDQMKQCGFELVGPNSTIWTGSRVQLIDKDRAFFGARVVKRGAVEASSYLYAISTKKNEANIMTHEVIPIVGLDNRVKIAGGKGTKENPYKITI